MKKSEYANYLRKRQLERSFETSKLLGISKKTFDKYVKMSSDDDIIDSYRICSCCGQEWVTRKEMESLIQRYDDPEKILDEIPSGHE